jgi:C1A family cysteine protease
VDLKHRDVYVAPASDGIAYVGQHNPLIVGYSDDGGYWIVRNSWDKTWADGGCGLIKYGEVKIDIFSKQGIQMIDPDVWVKRR